MPSTLLNVPLVGQRNSADCLPVCVEMVLRFYGAHVDPAWLCALLECSAIGTAGFKVRKLARFGYDVEYGPASDARRLIQALHRGFPPILLVSTAALPYWRVDTAHAVVLVGWDDEYATLNDPAFPDRQRVAVAELMLAWSDFDQLFAVISPTTGAPAIPLPSLPRE